MALIATTRRYSFRGVHSLNTGVHREKTHGHQYFLEVSFHKCDVEDVNREVMKQVLEKLDMRDLTHVLEPATGEVLVEWIHDQLDVALPGGKILGVALQETRKNRFVSGRSNARLI